MWLDLSLNPITHPRCMDGACPNHETTSGAKGKKRETTSIMPQHRKTKKRDGMERVEKESTGM